MRTPSHNAGWCIALLAATTPSVAIAGWLDEGAVHLFGEAKKVVPPLVATVLAVPQVVLETARDTITNTLHVVTHPEELIKNPFGTAATLLNPVAGGLVGGAPSVLERLTQRGNEIYRGWVGKPPCNAVYTIGQLSTKEEATLGEGDKFIAFLTTPGKYMNLSGWDHTGCEAEGRGVPVRTAQHSMDKFWTIDVKLISLTVEGVAVKGVAAPPGKFIRLEIMPNRPAHDVVDQRPPTPSDVIFFGGPVMVDHHGDRTHLEIHPIAVFRFVDVQKPPPQSEPLPSPSEAGATRTPSPPDSAPATLKDFPAKYTVTSGDNLSTIANLYYERQDWKWVFRANRNLIRVPDLIFPGQTLLVPSARPPSHVRSNQ